MRRTWLALVVVALAASSCGAPPSDDEDDFGPAEEEELVEVGGTEDTSPMETAAPETEGTDPEEPQSDVLAIATLLPEIEGIDSGSFDGEGWLRLDLSGVIPSDPGVFSFSYGVWVRTADDDLIRIWWEGTELAADPLASSACLRQATACPDGIFPVGVELSEDLDALAFYFEASIFDSSDLPTFSAWVEVQETADAEPLMLDFDSGARYPIDLSQVDQAFR